METDGRQTFNGRLAFVRLGLITAMIVFAAGAARAQFRTAEPQESMALTGDLALDLRLTLPDASDPQTTQKKARPARLSAMRAALFSAVIPGAGQAYAKSYWQAAGFLAVEVVGWFIYAKNHSSGDQREQQFKDYADANWSVVDYAQWMQTNFPGLGPNPIISLDPAVNPWNRIDWSLLNSYELKVAALGVNGFTHTLPPRPDQQYYEEIGKYPQFGGGWDDAAAFGFTPADVLTMNVSPHFLHYRDMRGEANQFYDNATAASYVLLANHVFSALEAAWNASRINHRIALQGSLVPVDRGIGWVELVPTAKLAVEL